MEKEDVWQKFLGKDDVPSLETGEETKRLAVMNIDWNLIEAQDLYVLFKTMAPTMGNIESVTIYLSDFGKEKLQEEQLQGPSNVLLSKSEYEKKKSIEKKLEKHKEIEKKQRLELKKEKKHKKKEKELVIEGEEDITDKLHPERVREYEFNKLKYYYAVVVCDSVDTAMHLYNECDGREIETTSSHLDVRFIPDDINFEGREILNECKKMPDNYKPKQNIYSKQIQSSDADLTWDKNPLSMDVLKNYDSFKDLNEQDFSNYLASSDEDEDDIANEAFGIAEGDEEDDQEDAGEIDQEVEFDHESDNEEQVKFGDEEVDEEEKVSKKGNKYLNLIKLAKSKAPRSKFSSKDEEVHMEQTFDDGLSEIGKEIVKKVKSEELKENETWWETAERKRKEKKKKSKKERKEKFKEEQEEEEKPEDKKEKEKKKANLELLMDDGKDEKGYNMRRDNIKERQRRKKDKSENIGSTVEDFDLDDSRFPSLINDPDFNLDPTHPKFKNTKIVEKIRSEKLKKKPTVNKTENTIDDRVEKLKRKTQEMNQKKLKKKKL